MIPKKPFENQATHSSKNCLVALCVEVTYVLWAAGLYLRHFGMVWDFVACGAGPRSLAWAAASGSRRTTGG